MIFSLSLILINVVNILLKNAAAEYSQEAFLMPPEIRVSKWVSDEDRDDYMDVYDDNSVRILEWNNEIDTAAIQISGFGSHEYVISQHVAAVFIECRAQYPVEWLFHNSKFVTEDLHGIRMKTFRRSESVKDPSTNVFIASLEITTPSNRATGNYTCTGTGSNYNLMNNIFIFWEGNSPPYLVLSGKVLEIEVVPNESYVTLPCYVSDPRKTSIHLLKDVGGEFKSLPELISSSKYDPKIGFILTYRNVSDVIGRYRCSSADDDSGMVEVLIKQPSLTDRSSNKVCEGNGCFRRLVSSGTRFYFDQHNEEIICCGKGGRGKQTQMHTLYCSNPSVCRMYEPAIYSTRGSNGKRSGNGTCVAEKIYPRDFGLVRCRGNGIDVFTYVYTEFWTPEQENLKAVFDWTHLNPQNMVHIILHSSRPYYNRQQVTVTCQTLHSYFSDGIKWGLKWRNGSISYFDSIISTEIDPRLHGIRSTNLKLNFDMAELICFAPVWNSSEWVSKTLKLEIRPSRTPTIIGDPIELLTFSLNETEKIVECISKAEPVAKVKWTRNDEDVPKSMVIWNQNGTSVLLFKTVTYETHAEYKCIAKNEVGEAVKSFKIFVEDRRHTKWSTAFIVVVPILVIISIGTVAFLVWKMQLQKKVVSHLTRVVFREERS